MVSNRADAYGLERARAAGIATEVVPHGDYPSREAFDAALAAAIDRHAPDVLAMAGFMRILTPGFTRRYLGRALNIHPSLLPKHPGLKTHAAALAAGDAEHGASVHFVTEALDGGPLVLQGAFKIRPDDDAVSLSERVMTEVELKIYPQAVAWLASGALQLRDDGAWLHGRPLTAPAGFEAVDGAFR